MFTGIVEALGKVTGMEREGSNVHFTIASSISDDLKIDQSLSHDGVCLTVIGKGAGTHTVTAVEETLRRSNLGQWNPGHLVNLERAMSAASRFDGHIVQGHVDSTGQVESVQEQGGSWLFTFLYPPSQSQLLVDKGSVTVNGTSLTVVNPTQTTFSVAIIPFTFEHTNFKNLKPGDPVNLEFDILGKYLLKMIHPYLDRMKGS